MSTPYDALAPFVRDAAITQEKTILDRALAHMTAGTLTADDARIAIVQLHTLREFALVLTRQQRQRQALREPEVQHA